ncbi:hypothetical protein MRS44_014792 [Fusarium solani]|uniref:uncharacterized protein n=1 Tax=Fusarium solani TaxID=169388 RepID=UPI0032C4A1A0|nr:hypothetical protein MRS44_014792 [Fusarium solani]
MMLRMDQKWLKLLDLHTRAVSAVRTGHNPTMINFYWSYWGWHRTTPRYFYVITPCKTSKNCLSCLSLVRRPELFYEWPVDGGMAGGTATVAEILALGDRIRGHPFTVRWVKKADFEAGTADLTPMWEEVHPTTAALPKEQREETAKVIPKGLLAMVGIQEPENVVENGGYTGRLSQPP